MTHLNIQQGLNIEIVSTNLIKKLYEAALSVPEPLEGELDAAYMSGNLLVDKSYRALVEYLTNRFDDLHINVTDSYYIPFEDSAVLSVLLANNIGSDGIGITEAEAANATFTSSTFLDNTDITSFNAFKYFTKANTNPPENLFKGCTSLTSIDMSNITALSASEFRDSGLSGEISLPNLTSLGDRAFLSSGITSVVNLGSVTNIPQYCFNGCTNLTSVTLPSTCLTINLEGFRNCSSLTTLNAQNVKTITGYYSLGGLTMSNLTLPAIETIGRRSLSGSNIGVLDLGPNLSYIGDQAFWDSTYPVFIFRGTTVPLFDAISTTNKFLYNMSNVTIYVPESALNDYKTAWPDMASNIVKIEGSVYDTQ